MITLIAALDAYHGIGKGAEIPWKQRNDLQRFKALTYNHTVICGRKTFETFPPGGLPNRRHLVLTSDPSKIQEATNVRAHPSVQSLYADAWMTGDVFVIGGGEIYKLFMPRADRLMLTRIHGSKNQCDVFFPEFDVAHWTKIASEAYDRDSHNSFEYTFETYVRK